MASYLDSLADLLRKGSDTLVNLPTEAQRFFTNPQAFTQAITGKNLLPKETGFVAGATGLPAKNPIQGGALNPAAAPYQEGYEQGEPVAIASMAVPAYVGALRAGAPKAYNALENYMVKSGGMIPLEAYHGTPHKIQGNFDINKVGTGEGNQTFSHGMYFAENPKVAGQYQKALSGRTDLGQMPSDPAFIHAVESFREYGTPLEKIPTEMKKAYKSVTDKDIQLAIQATEKGNLYKVDIPDEYMPNMLHWDKPLTEQTPQVKKALESLGIKTDKQKLNEFDNALLEALTGDARTTLPNQPKNPLGSEIYERLLKGDPASKSLKLNEFGIKGVSYLDEGSRGWRMLTPEESTSGKYVVGKHPSGGPEQKYFDNLKEAQDYFNKNQTRNHVVFEPSNVKILEENGKPVSRKALIEEQVKKLKD